ncbi:MAG: PQQ-dependent sugar dehydrogenase [Saprospiraceae bacterium]
MKKRGRIQIIDALGEKKPEPFLDITNKVNAQASERGLLGLAFHPDYIDNGYFFVNYTNGNGHTVVERYTVLADNPDLADLPVQKQSLPSINPVPTTMEAISILDRMVIYTLVWAMAEEQAISQTMP